jgi:hypothetical protein
MPNEPSVMIKARPKNMMMMIPELASTTKKDEETNF